MTVTKLRTAMTMVAEPGTNVASCATSLVSHGRPCAAIPRPAKHLGRMGRYFWTKPTRGNDMAKKMDHRTLHTKAIKYLGGLQDIIDQLKMLGDHPLDGDNTLLNIRERLEFLSRR
jgi:hypothetical protein